MLGHGQNALRALGRQESVQTRRQGVTARRLFEQPQRDQRIQQDGQAAQIAPKRAGQFRRRQRLREPAR